MNSYFSAAKRGDVDTIARKLADPSLDLNAQDATGNTAVHYAAKFGHVDLVELLLESGRPIDVAMLNKEGKSALNTAAENSHIEVYQLLLRCKEHVPVSVLPVSDELYEAPTTDEPSQGVATLSIAAPPQSLQLMSAQDSAALQQLMQAQSIQARLSAQQMQLQTQTQEESRIKVASKDAQVEYLQQQLQHKQDQMSELLISHKQLLAKCSGDSQSASQQVASALARLEESQMRCSELDATLRAKNKEAELTAGALIDHKTRSESDSHETKARLKSAEEQLARKAHILEQQAVDVTNLTVEVTALKAELVRLRDHAASADAKTMATAMEAAAHGMETATLKEREEVLVHELLAAESKAELVEAKLHVKNNEWESIKAETFIFKAKAEEADIERKSAEATVAHLNAELKELGARFASLAAASAEKGMTWEAEANKLRVTEQLLLEETRAKDNFKAELQATLNKLGESQLDFTNRLAAKEKQLVEFEASVADKMNTVSMLERDVRLLERDLSVKNDENEMLLAKITKDEKLLADRENTLKTVSRVKEHTEGVVVELETKLVALAAAGARMDEEMVLLKEQSLRLRSDCEAASAAKADAKKETQIIALRGAEVEKELAAAHEDLESTRSMMRAWSVSAEAEKKQLQDQLGAAHNTARGLTAQIEELTDDKEKKDMDIQVLLEQTTITERELNDAITWREAAEVKLTELAEFEEAHDGLTAQLAQAKALFSQMNTEIQNLRVRVKMEEEENQQLQNKLQTLKRQLGASTESSAAPSWA